MRSAVLVSILLVLVAATPLFLGCASRRAGKHVPYARRDQAVVRVEGTREVVGVAGDVGYDVRVVRVDGVCRGGRLLALDPGPHRIQVRWSRVEMPTGFGQGLNRDHAPSTRWVKTDGGCCDVDVDVRAGRVYTLVWDAGRPAKCPFRVCEVPQCP